MTVCPPDSGSVISAFLDLISRRCLRQSSLRWATSFSSGSWILCKSNEELMRLRPKFTWRATDPALNVLIAKSSTANQSKHNKQNTKLAPNFLNLATPLMNRNWSRRHSVSFTKKVDAHASAASDARDSCVYRWQDRVLCGHRRTLPVFCLRLVVGGVFQKRHPMKKGGEFDRPQRWWDKTYIWVDFPVQEDHQPVRQACQNPRRWPSGLVYFSICSF